MARDADSRPAGVSIDAAQRTGQPQCEAIHVFGRCSGVPAGRWTLTCQYGHAAVMDLCWWHGIRSAADATCRGCADGPGGRERPAVLTPVDQPDEPLAPVIPIGASRITAAGQTALRT